MFIRRNQKRGGRPKGKRPYGCKEDRPYGFGFVSGLMVSIVCFFSFFLRLIQKEDEKRRKHENDAFKVAPTKTSSLTFELTGFYGAQRSKNPVQ